MALDPTRFVALLLGLCAACVGDTPALSGPSGNEPGATEGDAGTHAAPCASLAVAAEGVTLLRGQSGALRVRVTGHGARDQVTLRVFGAPPGLSVPSEILVPPGRPDALEIDVGVSEEAPHGVTKLQLSASCGDSGAASAEARVVVRGATGALDMSYGVQGTANVPLPGARLTAAIADGADDAIVASGIVNRTGGGDRYEDDLLVARITASGAVDAAFGTSGTVLVARPTGPGVPYALWSAPRGALVKTATGYAHTALFRMDSTYTSFVLRTLVSNDGSTALVTPAEPAPFPHGLWSALVPEPDRDDGAFFLFLGSAMSPYVERYTAGHALDAAWGADGRFDIASLFGAPAPQLRTHAMTATRIALIVNAKDGVDASAEPWLLLLDRKTGQLVRRQSLADLHVGTAPVWLTTSPDAATFRVASAFARRSIDASGAVVGSDETFVDGGAGAGVYTGPIDAGREILLQYSEGAARLHVIGADGKRATAADGAVLEAFEGASDTHVVNVIPASEGRVVVVSASNDAATGWVMRRYWL